MSKPVDRNRVLSQGELDCEYLRLAKLRKAGWRLNLTEMAFIHLYEKMMKDGEEPRPCCTCGRSTGV